MTGNSAPHRDAAIKVTKAVHVLAWFSIESCVLYLVYAGFAGRSGRRAAVAAGTIAGEALIFAANGFRCPLTDIAERLGADHGSVTDIYLPARLARHLPEIHLPLLVTAAYLHRRNIRRDMLTRSPNAVKLRSPSPYRARFDRKVPMVRWQFYYCVSFARV